MPPGPWALATTMASSWRPTWAGSPWATSTTRSPPPGPQRRRDRRRPPPPRRSAAGPGEVLDDAGPQAPPGRRYGRRRGPGLDGLALVGRYLLLSIEGGLPLGDVKGPDAAGPRAGPGRRRGNPHRRRTGWTGRRFPGGPCGFLRSAPLRGAQGLRCGQVRPISRGNGTRRPLDRRFWTAGAGASARRDRRECPDPHLVEVGHQGPDPWVRSSVGAEGPDQPVPLGVGRRHRPVGLAWVRKGAVRLQTHLLLDRPAIDWPCRT